MDGNELPSSNYQTYIDNLSSNDGKIQLESLKELNLLRTDCNTRNLFIDHCYVNVLESIISNLKHGWPDIPEDQEYEFSHFFLDEPHPDGWLILNKHMKISEPSYKLDKIIDLLENFIKTNKLVFLFIESNNHNNVVKEELISSLASFPDRAANKLKCHNKDVFFPKNFFKKVSEGILSALMHIHKLIKTDHNASTSFLSELIGKLGVTGGHDVMLEELVPSLVELSGSDFIWRRIIQQLMANIQDRCLEPVFISVLRNIPWYGYMDQFFGDLITTNPKLEYIITKKCFLYTQFDQDYIIQNLVGYLARSESRRAIFMQTLSFLLDVWGDRSALKHTSYTRHFYITKLIFVFMAFIEKFKVNFKQHKQALMRSVMHAAQVHIESPQANIRLIGMLAAKHLTAMFDPDGPKLEFQVEDGPEQHHLLALLKIPAEPRIKQDDQELTLKLMEMKVDNQDTHGKSQENNRNKTISSDLDSDDDLEPYHIPENTRKERMTRPTYIRDCLLGLIETEKPEWTEKCLQSMEAIIRATPDNIHEIAEETAKVLLHLDDSYNIANFSLLRRNSMLAIVTVSPVQTTNYLTSQFYERNYNIRQRLDILETLAAASQELSNPTNKETDKINIPPSKVFNHIDPCDWQKIIEERLKKKTRIISRGRTIPENVPVKNRFFNVAGLFFFPLINYVDKKNVGLDLYGDDNFVLGRLVYTLGIIISAAANSPVCKQMTAPMLDLIWTLRYHTQAYVRQSLQFALSMVLLSVPGHALLTDHQVELYECRHWLTDVVEQDPDDECRNLAKQALSLIMNLAKKEYGEDLT